MVVAGDENNTSKVPLCNLDIASLLPFSLSSQEVFVIAVAPGRL
jgi:hypothetical protein